MDSYSRSDIQVFNGMVMQGEHASWWLGGFGTYAKMIKKVVIDLDGTCSTNCSTHWHAQVDPGHKCFGIKFAVRVFDLWKQMLRHPDIEVVFVHPKAARHYNFHDPSPWGPKSMDRWNSDLCPDVLGTVFHTLRQDPLGLAKYGQQMKGIWVQRDGSEGCVIFQGSGCVDLIPEHRRRFSILDKGSKFSWIRTPSLHC
jgi:hypothetical protein